MNKLGIYIHIPFCIRKCLYCDFCSDKAQNEAQMHRYTDALIAEMEANAEKASSYTVDTVFFGGGTPTLLPLSDMERLFGALRRLFCLSPRVEITVEANPATASRDKLFFLRQLGVNRLSIGVQSTEEKELAALGRAHSAADARAFFADARAVGFENVNVDLMYGIPYQTVESFASTLDEVLSWAPEHISAYSLIVEDGTPFYRMKNELALPDEDTEDALHALLCERLSSFGYTHYEISNFAKKGYECRHNLHYWRAEEYLGFGLAAYSYFDGIRYGNDRDMEKYLSSPFLSVSDRELLNEDERAYEYIMLHLRLKEGVDIKAYEKLFGVKIKEKHQDVISRFVSLGFMVDDGERIFLSEKGMRFSNTVLVEFM